jgi:predicted phosphoribosyltransferase
MMTAMGNTLTLSIAMLRKKILQKIIVAVPFTLRQLKKFEQNTDEFIYLIALKVLGSWRLYEFYQVQDKRSNGDAECHRSYYRNKNKTSLFKTFQDEEIRNRYSINFSYA